MLETYLEEIERKRNGRRIFWIAVTVSSVFLYLFFQGYYPYVRITAPELVQNESVTKPQVVRAFGIITVRTSPAPDSITVRLPNGTERKLENDEKGFFDFGRHEVSIEKDGHLPIRLELPLDKSNAFSINVFNLLKNPTETEFPIGFDRFDVVNGDVAIGREKSDGKSGRIYRPLGPDFSPIPGAGFRTDARPLGGGFFEKDGRIFGYDPESKSLRSVTPLSGSGSESCHGGIFDGGEIRCPETLAAVPVRSASPTGRPFGFGGYSVRTESRIVHKENGRLLATERPKTATGTLIHATFQVGGKAYRISNGKLVPTSARNAKYETGGLDTVAMAYSFGKETVMVGYLNGNVAFDLVDEHGVRFVRTLGNGNAADVTVENLAGAYLFEIGDRLLAYYKGAVAPSEIASGVTKFLGFWNASILFEKEGKTFRLPIEIGENAAEESK